MFQMYYPTVPTSLDVNSFIYFSHTPVIVKYLNCSDDIFKLYYKCTTNVELYLQVGRDEKQVYMMSGDSVSHSSDCLFLLYSHNSH